MSKTAHSNGRRPGRWSEFGGWLFVFAGSGTIAALAPSRQFDPETQPAEKERPFAQAARDDLRSPIWSLSFSRDSSQLALTTVAGDVWVKDLASGQRSLIQRGPVEFPQSVAFSSDGTALALGGAGPAVRVLDAGRGGELDPLHPDGKNNATLVAFSQDGKHLAAGGFAGALTLWEWGSRHRIVGLDVHSGGITSLAFSTDGTTLVTGDTSGLVKLWNVPAGKVRTTVKAYEPGGGLAAVALSPDGALLATTSYRDCTVRLWNPCDGSCVGALPKTDSGVRALAFSPGGDLLAIARGDGTAALWGVAGARELGSVRANKRGLQTLAFSGDGRLLATGGADGCLRLWDVSQALAGERRAGIE